MLYIIIIIIIIITSTVVIDALALNANLSLSANKPREWVIYKGCVVFPLQWTAFVWVWMDVMYNTEHSLINILL